MSWVRGLSIAVVALFCALLLPSAALADRDFTARFSVNDTGNITLAANALMTCPVAVAGCTAAQQGALSNTTSNDALNNNNWAMTYVDVDADAATFNSSTSNLVLPAGSTVLFAGLYYGGDWSGTGTNAAPNATARNTVKFKAPGAAAYTSLTASTLDDSTLNVGRYQGFVDVTSRVRAAGAGVYGVADVQAGKGSDHYAGWSLVVAYRDTTQPARNLTVTDGLRTIRTTDAPTAIPVSGFQTPPAGTVKTTVGFIAYEGDLGIVGDTARLNATTLSNATSPATNFFNSSVSQTATRNPNPTNNFGFDADLFAADGVLGNNATSATITVTTSGDQYLPGVITFATELYAPKIEQTKTVSDDNGGLIEQGDTLTYKVSGTNTGQDGATGFTLRDPIPAATNYVPGSLNVVAGAGSTAGAKSDSAGNDTAEYDAANDRVVYRLGTGANATAGGTVAPGASYEVTFKVKVEGDLPDGLVLTNTATASFFSQSLGTPLTAESSVPATVASPDLRMTKTRTSGPLVAGTQGTWELKVDNHGAAKSQGPVTVTDTLPSNLTPNAAAGTGWTCAISGQTVTCTRSDALAVGASFPAVVLKATLDAGAGGTVENTASVAGGGDGKVGDNAGTDTTPAVPQADLTITKTAPDSAYVVGDTITYTLTVRNNGPSVSTGVGVSDPIPGALTALSATSTQGTCDLTVTCTVGRLAPGATATITIKARAESASAGSTVANTARVAGDQPDPTSGNDTSTASVKVGAVDLAVTKTGPATVNAGGAISWVVDATNSGPSAATGVALVDVLPAGVTGATATVTTGAATCTVAGGTIRCAIGALAVGQHVAVRVDATVAPGTTGTVTNTASVSGAEKDVNPVNDTAAKDTAIAATADLALTKTAPATAQAGSTIDYVLTVRNLGPSSAAATKVVDTLPAGVSFVSADAGCTNASGTVTCTIGTLASGAQAVRTIRVTVGSGTTGTVTNSATASSTTPDGDTTNNTAKVATTVPAKAGLSLQKTASTTTAAPGDTVTYTLTAGNTGPGDAADVVISDPLPAGVSFVSAAGCTANAGTVTCALGTVAAGTSKTRTIVVKVDPVLSVAAHDEQLAITKVEQHLSLANGETASTTLTCGAGYLLTDASVRLDAVDQDTGTLADIQVLRAESISRSTYAITVRNTAGGAAQVKLLGVCVPASTGGHDLIVGDPVSATASLAPGRHDLTVACGPGQQPISPSFTAAGGVARVVASEPSGDGWRFGVEVAGDTAAVTVAVRCLEDQVSVADGHTHTLLYDHVERTVTVPARSVVNESVICADDAKGIVASYDLNTGLLPAGTDPQPKTRVFRLVNASDTAHTAKIDLICLKDRLGAPIAVKDVVNSASVSSSTPDTDPSDNADDATFTVRGAAPVAPVAPVTTAAAPKADGTPAPQDDGGTSAADGTVTQSGTVTKKLALVSLGSAATLTGVSAPALALTVDCARATCAGTAVVKTTAALAGRKRGATLGTTTFSVEAGAKRVVKIKLAKAAARALRAAKVKAVRVELRLPGRAVQVRRVTVR